MESAPVLSKLVESVGVSNPLQRRRLHNFLSQQDDIYFKHAESICKALVQLGEYYSLGQHDLVDAYNSMLNEMRRLQIDFRKTGRYQDLETESVADDIYHNSQRMLRYMLGLGLSQILWENHYKIYRFFRESLQNQPTPTRYLEIGAGHGLYLAAAIEDLSESKFSVIDISQTALDTTVGILRAFGLDPNQVALTCSDALTMDSSTATYDFITMGEVLEHVEFPGTLLRTVGRLLSPNGRMFITTCANCPAVEHIYLFRNVSEIRELFETAGYYVEEERFWASEPIPEAEWELEKVSINYSALIQPIKN